MNQSFQIDSLFEAMGKVYVLSHKLSEGEFSLTDLSTLGGVPIERWADIPRSLDAKGSQRYDVFAFALQNPSDRSRLVKGQVVDLKE